MMETAYWWLFMLALTVIAVATLFMLILAIRGPRTADRILGVSVSGTLMAIAIAILAYVMERDYLLDICLLLCLLNFLSVAVLVKVFTARHRERKAREETADE